MLATFGILLDRLNYVRSIANSNIINCKLQSKSVSNAWFCFILLLRNYQFFKIWFNTNKYFLFIIPILNIIRDTFNYYIFQNKFNKVKTIIDYESFKIHSNQCEVHDFSLLKFERSYFFMRCRMQSMFCIKYSKT